MTRVGTGRSGPGLEGAGRTGRRPGNAGTKQAILDAARESFGELGYDGATVRQVAAKAGVDPALLYHYFGSKQQLFVAAIEVRGLIEPHIGDLAEGPQDALGERLVRVMLGFWEDPETRPLFLGLVRSAVTDPEAAATLRRVMTEGPLAVVARASGSPDGELRAMLAGSHLLGIVLIRHILRVEPVASADVETLVGLLRPAVQRYLTGPLGQP
jgi:AcrR family transcriptional regulator